MMKEENNRWWHVNTACPFSLYPFSMDLGRCNARPAPNGSISVLSMSVLKLFTQHMSRSPPPKIPHNTYARTHTHYSGTHCCCCCRWTTTTTPSSWLLLCICTHITCTITHALWKVGLSLSKVDTQTLCRAKQRHGLICDNPGWTSNALLLLLCFIDSSSNSRVRSRLWKPSNDGNTWRDDRC